VLISQMLVSPAPVALSLDKGHVPALLFKVVYFREHISAYFITSFIITQGVSLWKCLNGIIKRREKQHNQTSWVRKHRAVELMNGI